ncbi:MAG: prepilin-type N-terminal cleavage/methylation domain-containing protein [Omnitrophica bacterium]|nr:prepilin-type N-terminal cleavage/methylation domain-containing protein [Candidatus Omnitrophota bacterium]
MNNNQKGITLIEVFLSVVIISTVMVGVLAVMIHTVTMSTLIDFDYTATNISKSRLERARSLVETSGFSALTQADFGEVDTLLGSDFRRSTTVTNPHASNTRLTKVEVEVEYKYRGAWKENAAVTMTTVFPNIE